MITSALQTFKPHLGYIVYPPPGTPWIMRVCPGSWPSKITSRRVRHRPRFDIVRDKTFVSLTAATSVSFLLLGNKRTSITLLRSALKGMSCQSRPGQVYQIAAYSRQLLPPSEPFFRPLSLKPCITHSDAGYTRFFLWWNHSRHCWPSAKSLSPRYRWCFCLTFSLPARP